MRKFKVGDEVLLSGKILGIDAHDGRLPYQVEIKWHNEGGYSNVWFDESMLQHKQPEQQPKLTWIYESGIWHTPICTHDSSQKAWFYRIDVVESGLFKVTIEPSNIDLGHGETLEDAKALAEFHNKGTEAKATEAIKSA